MTITADMAKDLRGSEVYDAQDEKVGKVGEVFVDNASGEPKWVTVNTGMFGTKETFVPLEGASAGSQGVRVAADKKTIKDAPKNDDSGELSENEEQRIYSHYGLSRTGDAAGTRDADRTATDRSARDRDDRRTEGHGADGMTRSEERLQVDKDTVETGKVRLRKYVVTENQQIEVPVSHEEVRLERETIEGGRPAGRELGDDEQSVTLHAERPVVTKEAHEVEKVRLGTRTVTENQTVSDQVRKEQVEVEDPQNVLHDGDRKGK